MMQKRNYFKIFLMMIMFLFLIISGGCGGGGGGGGNPSLPPTIPVLSGLQLSYGSLSPTFNSTTTQYTVNVLNSVSSIVVTPRTTSANATISVNGANTTSGSPSGAINLNVGSNTIVITVGNSAGIRTYTLTVTREGAGSAPSLLSLQLSSGSLSPAFSPTTTQYTVSVANSVTSVTVTPTTTSANALISVNGTNVPSGSPSGAINLNIGSSTISITVENSDGLRAYTVTVTRTPQSAYNKITAEEAHAMMTSLSNYILLDVRTEAEYREKRIMGAILIPHTEIEIRAAVELPNKNQIIIVYCQAGVRSETAARALVEMGYSNVYNMGGILDWTFGVISDMELPNWSDAADTWWWDAENVNITISTPQQLAGVARLVNSGLTNFSGKSITLANNIDLAGKMWDPIGGAAEFQGIFDGAGHTISNMELFSSAMEIGLFGTLGTTGIIKNVILTSTDITVGLT